MNSKILAELKKPGSEYRGATFWAWNGKLDLQELRWQIRALHGMGMGGFFMHSRVGLDTPYLGEEWMKCVETCVDEAEKLDMQAWLYDEDRWPSGAAGGLVTKNPKYRARTVIMSTYEKASDFKWRDETLAAFTAKINGTFISDIKRLKKGDMPGRLAAGHSLLSFDVKVADCISWHNGYTYLDTISHEAVKEFIKVTHEAYRKSFGKQLGGRIPGIFTDEPHVKQYDAKTVPWTENLPKIFKKRYGYDIIGRLPEVFFDIEGTRTNQPRWHMHDCTTFLFVDAFARQIGEWCEKNNCVHTGHVLNEGSMLGQTKVGVGSAMRFYEYMQAPGMDLLTEYAREYDTAKQVSSMARQFGQRWRLTETYGCTGWDFSWAGHKALSDWQAALGINLRCQHLSWYTMLGEAKRDYPAGIFYQSPWWQMYSKVEDYFGRIHVLMSRGTEVRDALVIHPIESLWSVTSLDLEAAKQVDRDFWQLRDTLLAANLDFDYGDEDVMARHAKIVRKGGKALLAIGKAAYTTAVVSHMVTIRKSTVDLLRKFAEAGGTVIFAGKAAEYVDAVADDAAAQLAKTCIAASGKKNDLVKAVEMTARRVSITDQKNQQIAPCLYCLREDRDAYYMFVCNTGHKQFGKQEHDEAVADRTAEFPQVKIDVYGEGNGAPLEVDLETGEVFAAMGKSTSVGWTLETSLPQLGSRMFILPRQKSKTKAAVRKPLKNVGTRTIRQAKWNYQLSEDNPLVLDRPSYRIGKDKWNKAEEILRIDTLVRKSMGLEPRGGRMMQPWAKDKLKDPRRTTVDLRYSFNATALPTGAMYLAIEMPGTFKATLNGTAIDLNIDAGWWVDKATRRIPLEPCMMRLGENTLELTCDYDELHPGLEIVYLLGRFGSQVKGTDITMTALPENLKTGDWTKQGLAFYSGNCCYTTKISTRLKKGQRLFVQIPGFKGTAVRVLVDGKPAGIVAWAPYELDITDFVTADSSTLGIEIIGHRRNSHGPHHLTPARISWFGPAEHRATPGETGTRNNAPKGAWTDEYTLVPVGLTAEPKLVVRR